MYSGASLKKSKHYSGINFIISSQTKLKVLEITLEIWVEWTGLFSGGGRRRFLIEKVILTPFSLSYSFLKLWGLVKWRMSNKDDIRSLHGMCLQSSHPLRCTHGFHQQCWWREGDYFLFYKIKLYGPKKVHRSIKVSHLFLFVNINTSFDTDKIIMTFTVFQSG